MLSKKPECIFVTKDLVKSLGINKALIVGEFYYWLAKKGSFWRKQSDVQELLKISQRQTQRLISELSDAGWITVKHNKFKGKWTGSTFYPGPTNSAKNTVAKYEAFLSHSNEKDYFISVDIKSIKPRKQATAYLNSAITQQLKQQDKLVFLSQNDMASWYGLNRNTMLRLMPDTNYQITESDNKYIITNK